MNSFSQLLQSKWMNIGGAILLAVIYGLFAAAHVMAFQKNHEWSLLLVVISETLVVGFLTFRTEPKTVSVIPFDWLVAIGGTFAPLFLRPVAWGILPLGSIAILIGTVLEIASLISLNRSIALVAAQRELKTAWMYRVVRHPLYASYFLILSGYILVNTTPANVLIYALTMVLLCVRIFREEKHLALDPAYRAYMREVRYRIIPLVF